MAIYLLKIIDDANLPLDECGQGQPLRSLVVSAPSEADARTLAQREVDEADGAGSWWLDAAATSCRLLDDKSEPGVILRYLGESLV